MSMNRAYIYYAALFCCISFGTMRCIQDDHLNARISVIDPVEIVDGTLISTVQAENVDAPSMVDIYSDALNDEDLWSMKSLLVYRNNKLITEAYPRDRSDIQKPQMIWSCTKQVIGMLTGLAIDEGFIDDIDDSISKYLSEELEGYEDKMNITIRQLLTMQSGIDYENGDHSDELLREIPDNSIDFILERPMKSSPGSEFYYHDGNPHILSAIIQKTTGMTTHEWANQVLFSRVGFENYSWIEYKDGVTMGGFGISTTPRELSKLALLVMNKGKWFSNSIISEEWINEMTQFQSTVDHLPYSFGFLWWIDKSRDVHFMWGSGGQFAFIVPSKELVVTVTAYPNTKGEYEIFPEEFLPYIDRIIDAAE